LKYEEEVKVAEMFLKLRRKTSKKSKKQMHSIFRDELKWYLYFDVGVTRLILF